MTPNYKEIALALHLQAHPCSSSQSSLQALLSFALSMFFKCCHFLQARQFRHMKQERKIKLEAKHK
jgi:hypothetical protein